VSCHVLKGALGEARISCEIKRLYMGRTVAGNRAAAEARKLGAARYFTALPCRRGHIAERYTSSHDCVVCSYDKMQARPAEQKRGYDENRRSRIANDPQFAECRRAQKRDAENKRRQRPDVKAARAAERMKRIADLKQRTPAWADHEKIRAFYRLAAAFSKLYVPHHVDHIVPLNGEHVSGLHVEHNLRVIPASDNLRKGAGFLEAA
jgi:hypothetical protein